MSVLLALAMGAMDPVWVGNAAIPNLSRAGASGFESFDHAVIAWMRRHQVPGAAIAVARNGRIVLARGYGWRTFSRDASGTKLAVPHRERL